MDLSRLQFQKFICLKFEVLLLPVCIFPTVLENFWNLYENHKEFWSSFLYFFCIFFTDFASQECKIRGNN